MSTSAPQEWQACIKSTSHTTPIKHVTFAYMTHYFIFTPHNNKKHHRLSHINKTFCLFSIEKKKSFTIPHIQQSTESSKSRQIMTNCSKSKSPGFRKSPGLHKIFALILYISPEMKDYKQLVSYLLFKVYRTYCEPH